MEQTQGEFVTRHTKIRCEDGLFVVLQGKNSINCDVIAEFQDKKGILGELGSMIFESLLARIGFHQEIELDWLDRSNVNVLATVVYRPLPDKTVTALDGTSTVGYGVEKVIKKENKKIVWHSYFLPDGKLLERDQQQEDSNNQEGPALPYYAIVQSIPEVSVFDSKTGNKTMSGDVDKVIDIENDVQMKSEFHKLKKHHLADHQTWLKE